MRGQAFEVFRLLIAAIVAGAVLMLLMNILNIIQPPGQDPQEALTSLLQKNGTYGGIGTTDYITFRSGMGIDLKAAAYKAQMDPQCVILEDDLPTGFDEVGEKKYLYTSNTPRRYKLQVDCDITQNNNDCPVECKVKIVSR